MEMLEQKTNKYKLPKLEELAKDFNIGQNGFVQS
jgi:hypothetical protein